MQAWIIFANSGAFVVHYCMVTLGLYILMNLCLQVAVCHEMDLQVHEQRAEGLPEYTA